MNAPYVFTLEYISRPPPDQTPRSVVVNKSTPWPDTRGSLTEWNLAANGVARVGDASRVEATFSAGVMYARLAGSVEPVAFTTFRLGGHSVLFEDDYQLQTSLGPAHAVRFDAGADVSIGLSRHAALAGGIRFVAGPDVQTALGVSAITNDSEVLSALPVSEIVQYFAPSPVALRLARWRLFAGLKLHD